MAQKSLNMNQAKQVQQLHADGIAIKEIVRRTGISRKTVRKYLRKIEAAAPLLEARALTSLSNNELAAIIYYHDPPPVADKRLRDAIIHFEHCKTTLHKTGVTKQLLWADYLSLHPQGYCYSQYCYLFRKYLKDSDPAFHWQYEPGEFTQIDFAGKKLSYLNKESGELIACEMFIAILPFSGLIFCIAVHTQQTCDFAHCINEMVRYIGGVTKTILCDNLRTAVSKADRYEPVFTELCQQLSTHYATTFSATRPAAPTDKAMVEGAVKIVYNHIYGPMHKEVPGSLEHLNAHIRTWLDKLNGKPYKASTESRRDIFEGQEKAALKTLPQTPYYVKKCKLVTVQRNYAIQLPDNKHYYSVPYQYVGSKVLVYFDSTSVEVYYQYERIAFHGRSSIEPSFNRIADHMPPHHQHMLQRQGWTVEELLTRAQMVGEYTRQSAERLLHSSIYPQQNYKACHAMLLLQNRYGCARLEAACQRAANVMRPTLTIIGNILEAGLDCSALLFEEEQKPITPHDNIRGRESYQ